MKTKKTHWKKLAPSNYLGSWDLEGETNATISKIEKKMLKTSPQAPEEECVVINLKEFVKPFIVNKTNLSSIEKATQSAYIEDWVGKQITLFVKNVKAFGNYVDAIRVRQSAPKAKAKPKLTPERFEKAIEAIENKKAKKEDLHKYDLTKEQIERLKAI